ncbi:hypothetical protein BsWGS_06100 [Bradybaena similaris]
MMDKLWVLFVFCIWCVDNSHGKPERCLHKPEQGMCMARIVRLHYDAASNSCVEFVYGGCGGNENNFENLKDCDDICVTEIRTTISDDKCSHKPEAGDCRDSFPRLYYDKGSNTCQEFTYSGCGGNTNNFLTLEQCHSECVQNTTQREVDCYAKPDTGTCKALMPRLYYDSQSNLCKQFTYGGCGGNSNNFQTVEECDKACVSMKRTAATYCYLDKQEGPCKQALKRLYYDPRANTCKEFIYGGCEGNDNNFNTFEECEQACIQKTPDNICALKSEKGNCKSMLFRYYYNSDTQMCGEFIYGGCGGNENNFETLDECESRCGNNAPVSMKTSFVILIVLVAHIFGKDILAVIS